MPGQKIESWKILASDDGNIARPEWHGKQEEEMKRIIMLGMTLLMLLASVGGCYIRAEDYDRDGRHGWGERHEGSEDHDRDGGHEERH